jgi:hypothetical protein
MPLKRLNARIRAIGENVAVFSVFATNPELLNNLYYTRLRARLYFSRTQYNISHAHSST